MSRKPYVFVLAVCLHSCATLLLGFAAADEQAYSHAQELLLEFAAIVFWGPLIVIPPRIIDGIPGGFVILMLMTSAIFGCLGVLIVSGTAAVVRRLGRAQ